jgi:UDP-N-acetylglucosamine 2-epimerase
LVKKKYQLPYKNFALAIMHPVSTDNKLKQKKNSQIFFESLKKINTNFIIIYPNNDFGSRYIFNEIIKLKSNKKFKLLPSMRFDFPAFQHTGVIAVS